MNELPLKRQKFLYFGTLIAPLLLIFPAGSFADQTKVEEAADKMSKMSVEETNGGKHSYVLVEPLNESIPFVTKISNEYYFWQTIFGKSKNNFAAVVNGNKENNLHFADFLIEKQLSFVYADVFSNRIFENHFKHEYYNFELMFQGLHSAQSDYSFCYLTQSQADALIISKGNVPVMEEYEKLIGTSVSIIMGENTYNWAIANIIFETGDYYITCKEVLGDFLMGFTKYPTEFKKQYCYFFNEYDYQNYYRINYLRSTYNTEQYKISLGTNNLLREVNHDDMFVIDVINSSFKSNDYLAVMFSFLLILVFAVHIFTIFVFNRLSGIKISSISIGLFLLAYSIFKIAFLIFGNVYLFSYYSLIIYSTLLFIGIISLAISLFTKKTFFVRIIQ